MPNYKSVAESVRAERNDSGYPTHVCNAGHVDQFADPGDFIVTEADGFRRVVKAAEFGEQFKGQSGRAKNAVDVEHRVSKTGDRKVSLREVTPFGCDDPVNGHVVDVEDPYVAPSDGPDFVLENPQAAESLGWGEVPDTVYDGESPSKEGDHQSEEARRQSEEGGQEQAVDVSHSDAADQGEPGDDVHNPQPQSAEALRQVKLAPEGATLVHRSPPSGVDPVDEYVDDDSLKASDVNDLGVDDPDEVEAERVRSPQNDEPVGPPAEDS